MSCGRPLARKLRPRKLSMSAIFFRFIEIALCRKGPQDLPASGFLLALTLALNSTVLAISIFMFQRADVLRGMQQAVLGLASEFLFVWVVLLAFNHSSRMLQSMTAVLGVDTVISLAFIPLLVLMPAVPGQASVFLGVLMLGLMLWGLIALGCILRHAVNVSLALGVAMAFVYNVAVYTLVALVF